MSGETEREVSGWTTDTLRDHFMRVIDERDQRYAERFSAQEKAVTAALSASEKAVAVAEVNAEKWRANANEWRKAMDDREREFVRKSELEAQEKNLNDIKARVDKTEGKGLGISAVWGVLVAVIMVALAVLGFALRT